MRERISLILALFYFFHFLGHPPAAAAPPTAPQYIFCRVASDTAAKCSVLTPDTDATSIVVETKIGWAGTYATALNITTNLGDPFQTFDLTGLDPQTVYYVRGEWRRWFGLRAGEVLCHASARCDNRAIRPRMQPSQLQLCVFGA